MERSSDLLPTISFLIFVEIVRFKLKLYGACNEVLAIRICSITYDIDIRLGGEPSVAVKYASEVVWASILHGPNKTIRVVLLYSSFYKI